MALHPQTRQILAMAQKAPLAHEDLEAARQRIEQTVGREVGEPMPVAEVRDLDALGVPVRLYKPEAATEPGTLIYLHGGGWVLGSIRTVDGVCRRLARGSGCAVLSVGYRLAPEHRWPAAIDDVEAAVAWLRTSGALHGAGAGKIALCGDSAGGHLATVVAMRLRDQGTPVDFQALVYPALDPSMSSSSYREMDGYALTRQEMSYFWDSFLPCAVDRTRPDVTPALGQLRGMPAGLIITAEYDVLRDEGESYASALAEAGGAVVVTRYQGVVHGFFRRLALFDAARGAVDQVATAVREALR